MPRAKIDDIDRLIRDAEKLDYGPVRTALCQEAVDIADSRRDDERAFEARLSLTDAACFGGQPDLLLVAFAWLLAKFDAEPDRFGGFWNQHKILWRYKWVMNALTEFPQFSLRQIEETLADMRRRYKASGSSMHAVHGQEEALAVLTGDRARASKAHAKANRTPRDWLSDCEACSQDWLVKYHRFFNRYEQAVNAADPVLAGEMTCAEVPHRTHARLLYPLFKLGRLDEAMHHHRVGYPMLTNNPGFITYVAEHIQFLVLTDNLSRAVRLAEKHLPAALVDPSPLNRLEVYTTLRFLFDRLRDVGKAEMKFRLPPTHPLKAADAVKTADLFAWFDAEARQLAAAFDARNGSDLRTKAITDQAKLKKQITPHPFIRRRTREELP